MIAIKRAYEDIINLIAVVTSPQRLMRFHLSMAARVRMAELIAREGKGELSPVEASELELYLELEQAFANARARARRQQSATGLDTAEA